MFRTKPGEGRALVEDWINRPTLRKLVEAFGGTWPEGDLETVVAGLAEWSEIWDYRGGTQSRLMFHDDHDEDPFEDLTYQAADELGLMNPVPPSDDIYDYMLILGGLATGVEPRVKYAAQLLDQGLTIRKQIAGLGSYRELHEKELPISRRYAPNGRYEIDHLAAMMAVVLGGQEVGPGLEHRDPIQIATVWELPSPLEREVSYAAYSAVGGDPNHRPANTAETYDLFLDVVPTQSGETALLITSAIYVPYQHLDALGVLGDKGLQVETIGLVSPALRRYGPQAYRQEVRSAIRSARGLLIRQMYS